MAVVPVQSQLLPENSAISLPRYAAMIGYDECAFMGVRTDTTPARCRSIWVKTERDMVRRYLAEAQAELEQVIGYRLSLSWEAGEQYSYRGRFVTNWGYVVQGGVKATTTISADEGVNLGSDPCVIGPLATTVTDEDEIRVFYPVSLVEDEIEIHPSDIDLAGGFVTIYVPKCRLVGPDFVDNPRTGIDYTVNANFLSVVDVKRVYNDPSTQAEFVYPHGLTGCSCSEATRDACLVPINGTLGIVDVKRASYVSGTWSPTTLACGCVPTQVRLNYQSGRVPLPVQAEDAIFRLAHSKMPEEPCACEPTRGIWQRDREVPEFVGKERLSCPFGISEGAWSAWTWAKALKQGQAGVL